MVRAISTTTLLAVVLLGAAGATDGPPSRQRLTPTEIETLRSIGPGAGTSGIAGIRTTTLHGDPTRSGLYTIQLAVPANTRIEAHSHPDDRVATVISGTWYFGYGDRHKESDLKALPAGSFYTEPAGLLHFARTGETSVVLQISGFGPTGTTYLARE
jgi:quercetin dioxygenase-like cupin family protein